MSRCSACVAMLVLALAAFVTRPATADITIYSTGFESGYSAGDLNGQQGWSDGGGGTTVYPGVVTVGAAVNLTGQDINHLDVTTGAGNCYYDVSHSLGSLANLSSSGVYNLTFDAANNKNVGRYSDDGFGLIAPFASGCKGAIWWAGAIRNEESGQPDTGYWHFVTDGGTYTTTVGAGLDSAVHMKIVVDGVNDLVYGEYNFGSGWQSTPQYACTAAEISAMSGLVYKHVDASAGGPLDTNGTTRPFEVNNINLSQIQGVPEPGSLALVATGLIGLLCYAWRRRK